MNAPTSPDPIEIAMQAEADGAPATGEAALLLRDQRRLIGWQIAAARGAVALRALAAVGALVAAVAVSALVWDARQARGVVVDAFAVPPDLAARGLSGEVLAAQVVDGLATLQSQTQTGLNSRGVSDGAGGVSVEIPGAGISLAELQKALRLWLGKETHVKGEAYRTANGIAVRARIAGDPPMRVEGSEADVEALTESVAQAVYAQTEPARYASWLDTREGPEAALASLRAAAARPYPPETLAAVHERIGFFSNLLGDARAADREARLALSLDPTSTRAANQRITYLTNLGQQEEALAWRLRANKQRRDTRVAQQPPYYRAAQTAFMLGNCHDAAPGIRRGIEQGIAGQRTPQMKAQVARSLAQCHDVSAARALIREALAMTNSDAATDRRVVSDRRVLLLAEASVQNSAEDWAWLIAQEDALLAILAFMSPDSRIRNGWVLMLALAHARTGDIAGAEAMLAGAPDDCDRCVLTRAQVAALAGRAAESERLFARAVAMMPSFAQPSHELGRARQARGDLAGALTAYRSAQKKQPRWADPFKGEGDVLLRQRRPAEAAKRYARAAEFAPRWGGLHLAWGDALATDGKPAEARAKWQAAAAMDLTAPERARLATVLR